MMKNIHSVQHPSKESCKSRRLLILDLHTQALEGWFGLTKLLVTALSTALHSNRTLVWGWNETQFMFTATQAIWSGPISERKNIDLGGILVDCPENNHPLGGPFECFYQQLSSCSIYDATPQELLEVGRNPFNTHNRLAVLDVSANSAKSISMFYPPVGWIRKITSVITNPERLQSALMAIEESGAQLFAAAVSAYIFRLKPEIVTQFNAKHKKRFGIGKTIWGLHVRHGDVKSFHRAIKHKRIFTFDSYFGVARDLSYERKQSPDLLFVSTDSTKADQVENMFRKFEKRKRTTSNDVDDDSDDDEAEIESPFGDVEESIAVQHKTWYHVRPPKVFSINNTQRYRTEHGFVVAAADECVDDHLLPRHYNGKTNNKKKLCKIPMQFDVPVMNEVYGGTTAIEEEPRARRLMRLFAEAIEDVYLLSMTDVIVAAASSHFSTMAIHLLWARTGCRNIDASYRFLDEDTAISGDSASAFLQATNLWNSSYTGPGPERWRIHTFRFISGLPGPPYSETEGKCAGVKTKLNYNPWSPEMRMRFVNGVPQVPEKVFYRETALWRADKNAEQWHLSCIRNVNDVNDSYAVLAITELVALGVEHYSNSHPWEASECWQAAVAVAKDYEFILVRSTYQSVMTVVDGNLRTLYAAASKYSLLSKQLSVPAIESRSRNVETTTAKSKPVADRHRNQDSDPVENILLPKRFASKDKQPRSKRDKDAAEEPTEFQRKIRNVLANMHNLESEISGLKELLQELL